MTEDYFMDLSGKKVVIAGGAGAIGGATVKTALQRGAEVMAIDVRQEAFAELFDSLTLEQSKRLQTTMIDVLDDLSVAQKLTTIAENFPYDSYIHCIGFAYGEVFEKTDLKTFRKDIDLNLTSVYTCLEKVLNYFVTQSICNASIVIVGSINSDFYLGCPAYSAAKAGLENLVKSIATEYGSKNIRCNMVSPGSVETRAWAHRIAKDPKIFEKVLRWYPLKRLVQPEEVSHAIHFLASNLASAITGTNLRVDAGLTAGLRLAAADITGNDSFLD